MSRMPKAIGTYAMWRALSFTNKCCNSFIREEFWVIFSHRILPLFLIFLRKKFTDLARFIANHIITIFSINPTKHKITAYLNSNALIGSWYEPMRTEESFLDVPENVMM